MKLLSEIFQSFGDAYDLIKAEAKERQKPRRVVSVHAEEDGINVIFHTGDHVIIPYVDYCNWYNEIKRDCRLFWRLDPDKMTDLNIDHEEILLYLRWEMGFLGVYLPIEEP